MMRDDRTTVGICRFSEYVNWNFLQLCIKVGIYYLFCAWYVKGRYPTVQNQSILTICDFRCIFTMRFRLGIYKIPQLNIISVRRCMSRKRTRK